jgi:hypothetical protein
MFSIPAAMPGALTGGEKYFSRFPALNSICVTIAVLMLGFRKSNGPNIVPPDLFLINGSIEEQYGVIPAFQQVSFSRQNHGRTLDR